MMMKGTDGKSGEERSLHTFNACPTIAVDPEHPKADALVHLRS